MSTEEKARAYDEALEKAKTEIDTKGIGETVNLCKHLFPELRESEDERIRKVIYKLMLGMREEIFTSQDEIVTKEKVLAYLEKQKEQKRRVYEYQFANEFENQVSHLLASVLNKEYEYSVGFVKHVAQSLLGYAKNELKSNYCLYGGYPSVGRCRWCYAACSARLTDVHTDDEKEYVRTIKSIISDFIRDKKPENLAYYQRIYDWLDGRHVPFSCGHENGAKWSEEDEKIRRNLMSLLTNMRGDRITEETYQKYYPWLKSLRPSWKPNEEQMEELNKARRFIPYNCDILESLYNDLKKLT